MSLRIPGPTPLPREVREALAQDMIGHRGPEYAALQRSLVEQLRLWFDTRGEVLVITASGTGVMEAALVNVLSPGDRVLAVSIGLFGERFAAIARAFGARVTTLGFPWGQAADADAVRRALEDKGPYAAILVTHNETSTGVTNDLEAIGRAAAASHSERPILIVDAVSSLGAMDVQADAWECDVVLTASQKALMAPPGLGFVSVSNRAWSVIDAATTPRFYWDFRKHQEYALRGQTPFTPGVTALYGVHAALKLMAEEGKEAVFRRHRRVGQAMRTGLEQLGLRLFAEPSRASNTVTTFITPDGWTADELQTRLREDHGVIVAGGQGPLKGRVTRIGHMGYVDVQSVEHVLSALSQVLGRH